MSDREHRTSDKDHRRTDSDLNSGDRTLFYLHELDDYKVKDEDPDIRNWELYDKEKKPIGKVDNLLVSKTSERVRYVDVEVDKSIIEENHEPYAMKGADKPHEIVNKEGHNHLIVPVDMIRLDRDKKRAYCEEISHGTFARTKRIPKGQPINSEYENYVLSTYRSNPSTGGATSAGSAGMNTPASGLGREENRTTQSTESRSGDIDMRGKHDTANTPPHRGDSSIPGGSSGPSATNRSNTGSGDIDMRSGSNSPGGNTSGPVDTPPAQPEGNIKGSSQSNPEFIDNNQRTEASKRHGDMETRGGTEDPSSLKNTESPSAWARQNDAEAARRSREEGNDSSER